MARGAANDLASGAADSNRFINANWNGTGGTFDQKYYSLGARLNATLPNPFKGLIPQPSAWPAIPSRSLSC